MSLGSRICLCLIAVAVLPALARADAITLKRGGEVRGEILAAGATNSVSVRTQTGLVITVPLEDVAKVQRRSMIREEYVTRSRQMPDTAEAHWELAEWCRTQSLTTQQTEQLELLVGLDPDHAEARRILGHVQQNGEWLTREEWMTRRGYVRHKGKWITQEEFDLVAENTAQKKAEKAWIPRVRLWLNWVMDGDPQKSQEGYAELAKIRDPDAVGALKQLMSNHPDVRVRDLLVRTLARMDGPAAAALLMQHYLMDADAGIRQQAKDVLDPARRGFAEEALVKALRSPNNSVVARAANLLGEIGTERCIPGLIDALVTSHQYNVQVPVTDGMSVTQGPNGQMSFGAPGGGSVGLPPQIEMMARTGQLPYGVGVNDTTPRTMKTVTVTANVQNSAVLTALQQLTGKNLGYNERDWHLWWAVQRS